MTDKTDPIADLGNEALFQLAVDLQVQLEKATAKGMRPVLYLLIEQRRKAADAIAKLVEVDASETAAIRALQNEVRLYGDLVESCRNLLLRGKEADRTISEQDREEMSEIVGRMQPDEKRLYNLQPESSD